MQVIQDLTAFEERLGRVTSLKKLTGSAYGGMCVCVCVVCVCVYTHMHACIHTYVYTYLYTNIAYIHTSHGLSVWRYVCVCV